MHLRAWGALSVTVAIVGADMKQDIHVTMTKQELQTALSKITEREEEIKVQMLPKRFNLSDEFDNGDINHFTHYDYLCQLIENGQPSAFAEHLKQITNDGLIRLLKIVKVNIFISYTEDEIYTRMKGN